LGDLGQASPVTFNNPANFLVPLNFSLPLINHTSTNNLFFNTTLARTLFSNIGLNEAAVDAITTPGWAKGNERLAIFRWIYLCNQRQLKPTLDLVVSVFGLSLSLLHGIYTVLIALFGWIYSRYPPPKTVAREEGGSLLQHIYNVLFGRFRRRNGKPAATEMDLLNDQNHRNAED